MTKREGPFSSKCITNSLSSIKDYPHLTRLTETIGNAKIKLKGGSFVSILNAIHLPLDSFEVPIYDPSKTKTSKFSFSPLFETQLI